MLDTHLQHHKLMIELEVGISVLQHDIEILKSKDCDDLEELIKHAERIEKCASMIVASEKKFKMFLDKTWDESNSKRGQVYEWWTAL